MGPRSTDFLNSLLDSLCSQLAVIDRSGDIKYVNKAWIEFGRKNGLSVDYDWIGKNYLNVCEVPNKEDILTTASGIRNVLQGQVESFTSDYPCHSPTETRWFNMTINRLITPEGEFYLVSHNEITARKIAEDKVLELSIKDPLTNLSNRRHFDDHFRKEWLRCLRNRQYISLVLIDIDYFKNYNDSFGHMQGDHCLQKVSREIGKFARRPSDLACRFGGEEFILLLGNTTLFQAQHIAEILRNNIFNLNIPHLKCSRVTISAGVHSILASDETSSIQLLEGADQALYSAKKKGRNRIESFFEAFSL